MQKIGDIPNTRADINGEFTDGNVAGGVPPTILPAEWFNTIQRELISVLSAAGITPDSNKFDQVSKAVSKLITDGGFLKTVNNLSEIKTAGAVAVAATLENLGLTGIGIGLSSQPTIENFDFQTFVFTSGANYIVSSSSWINVPSEISYPTGLIISIKVDYVSGTQIGLEIKPSTVSSANFRAWYLRLGGYLGSRTFTAREIRTSANPVPISGGGTGAITASAALANLGLSDVVHLPQLTGIVGTSRNAKMSIAAASATATFTADELIVQTALGGLQYKLSSFSKTINLATTGAGGMDTGTVPVTGFVAIYAIYNPTTQASALLAVNTTSVLAPEVYGGANMPSGYTASALVSVSPIASSKFKVSYLIGRKVSFPQVQVVAASATMPALTTVSIALAAPLNAITALGNSKVGGGSTAAASFSSMYIASDSLGTGYQEVRLGVNAGNGVDMAGNFSIDIITPQTLYYRFESDMTGSKAGSILISSYSF
ncbi:hypothetical protein [Yersinia intermedia]|uniref:hypothetical protein n=1 Tax=Yersinia intermedia TaxID=631 RepID=UPI0005E4BF40|nr:hypothetical protein [Yersinia intermedia]CND07983.1 tail fiber protein [Yersinia intermedia]